MPPLDIDQNRQPGFDSAQIEGNAQGLEALCGDLLQRFHDRVPTFPTPLKSLARVLCAQANAKFPACGQDVIITVFFLRFFIPAIITPWAFGVVDQTLHPLHGRSLILLSKLLQVCERAAPTDRPTHLRSHSTLSFFGRRITPTYGTPMILVALAAMCVLHRTRNRPADVETIPYSHHRAADDVCHGGW
jgi:hypothetical protein